MAAKKAKQKSNVSSSAKKQAAPFQWWIVAVGVVIVALIGILVLRSSHAATIWENGNPGHMIPDQECQNYGNGYKWVYNQNVACTKSYFGWGSSF